ncbi:hypothetical protein [Kitasatospora herbaricolor]|uniref:Uncharacterized protein n=1 Tax=Kitasatospora herbaricolor TaxID=68217 RepID=A0ABZ1W2J7_9ACTN|nr:hypothetical protein [Kitasatospora herbaricolor]
MMTFLGLPSTSRTVRPKASLSVVEAVLEEVAGLVEHGVFGVGVAGGEVDAVGQVVGRAVGRVGGPPDVEFGAGVAVRLVGGPAVTDGVVARPPQEIDGVEGMPGPRVGGQLEGAQVGAGGKVRPGGRARKALQNDPPSRLLKALAPASRDNDGTPHSPRVLPAHQADAKADEAGEHGAGQAGKEVVGTGEDRAGSRRRGRRRHRPAAG